ncbi:MAG: ribonuclease E/G [Myxococcota bacterium]
MTVRMLINASAQKELRIAIVEDGELMELDIEAADSGTLKGNIYKGVIHNVEASLEAAFVDIGAHKQGFLPFSEVSPASYHRRWNEERPPRINDVLRRGQEIIVQVGKDAIGEKGVTLTTYLSLPGRYVVLMPGSEANGISRKIEDEKVRRRIRTMASKVKKPDNCGFIVRTAGLGQTRPAIQRDLDNLVAQYQKMLDSGSKARAPSILHSEPDLIARTLRDYFNEDIDEVWIDNREEHDSAAAYFALVMPEYRDRIQLFQNPIPIFAYYHVEEQIEATFERQVSLPSGGSIVIDETEALVAVDVNTGRHTSEGNHEDTVFKTNCEAAEEIARQLKLRDLGGIVVIDFIDMEETEHKREVERVLAETAKEDKARYKIARINAKGLCMLTRQRIRQGMRKAFQDRCPVCTGTGWVRTPESHSLSLVRRVETRLAQGGVGETRIVTHRTTAEYLVNQRRSELLRLEREYRCRVIVVSRPDMDRSHDDVTYLSHGEILAEITDKLPPREERRTKRKRRRTKKKEPAHVSAQADEEPRKKKKKSKTGRKAGKMDGPEGAQDAEKPPALEAKGGTTFTGRPSPEMLEKMRAERQARLARRKGDDAADGVDERPDPQETVGQDSRIPARKRSVADRRSSVDGDGDPPRQRPSEPGAEEGSRPSRADADGANGAPDALPSAEGEQARRSIIDRIFGSR